MPFDKMKELPTREEAIGQILGLILSPGAQPCRRTPLLGRPPDIREDSHDPLSRLTCGR